MKSLSGRFAKIINLLNFDQKREIPRKKFGQKWYYVEGIYIMKYTNFRKISPKETREK